MRKRRLLSVLGAAVVAAGLFAGCSSSSSPRGDGIYVDGDGDGEYEYYEYPEEPDYGPEDS